MDDNIKLVHALETNVDKVDKSCRNKLQEVLDLDKKLTGVAIIATVKGDDVEDMLLTNVQMKGNPTQFLGAVRYLEEEVMMRFRKLINVDDE